MTPGLATGFGKENECAAKYSGLICNIRTIIQNCATIWESIHGMRRLCEPFPLWFLSFNAIKDQLYRPAFKTEEPEKHQPVFGNSFQRPVSLSFPRLKIGLWWWTTHVDHWLKVLRRCFTLSWTIFPHLQCTPAPRKFYKASIGISDI